MATEPDQHLHDVRSVNGPVRGTGSRRKSSDEGAATIADFVTPAAERTTNFGPFDAFENDCLPLRSTVVMSRCHGDGLAGRARPTGNARSAAM